MDLDTTTIVELPSGEVGSKILKLDIKEIVYVESRLPDIASVNKVTAPELMKTFIEGYQSLNKIVAKVSYEYNLACTNADKRKAVIMLDLMPEILKSKGLATTKNPMGSEDLRKAVLMQDKEYITLLETIHALEAAHEFFKGKLKSIDMAYRSVKNIYYADDNDGNHHNLRNGFTPDYSKAYVSDGNGYIGIAKY